MAFDLLYNSSSGGAFSFLSQQILSTGGVVYGVRFNSEKLAIEHGNTDQFPLSEFRKSKYAESQLGTSFSYIKSTLQTGREVLFSGTPCQVKGLKLFLGKDYDNLLTVDFICHGTPSGKHFSEYLKYLQKKFNNNITGIDFRPKDFGWKKFYLKIVFEDGSSLLLPYRHSIYYWAFYKNLYLKKSCYTCKLNCCSMADFTLGDFWGASKTLSTIDNNKGISLVIANTCRARSFINKMNDCVLHSIPIASYNYVYEESNHKYDLSLRMKFDNYLHKYGYIRSAALFYWRYMFKERIKDLLKNNNKHIWTSSNNK